MCLDAKNSFFEADKGVAPFEHPLFSQDENGYTTRCPTLIRARIRDRSTSRKFVVLNHDLCEDG